MHLLVFGTFDGLHEGHYAFLKQAREKADRLTVVVAHDETVKQLKGRETMFPLAERMVAVKETSIPDEVIAGDSYLGNYLCLNKAKPDMIALGYDQQELGNDLSRWMKEVGQEIPIVTLTAYKPEKYKSSLLHEN